MGLGEFHYANGAIYRGSFHFGEKHGEGTFMYESETYEGSWVMNLREGKGIL